MATDDPDLAGEIPTARQEFTISNMNQASLDADDLEERSSSGSPATEGRFTVVDAMCIVAGMIMYIADLVTDLVVGVRYFRQGHILWSTMTFVFVLLPSVVLQYFSLRWFVSDLDEDQTHKSKGSLAKLWNWCQWLATHILQLGAIKRYWRTLQFGLLSRKNSAYYQEMVFDRVDITMLRLLESFMESAPQLVLQVYIMVTSEEFYWLTAIVSLSSLAFALGAYHKALRDSRPDKLNVSYWGMALRVLWRLFTITARVIALAFFASMYKWWVFVLAAVHWAVMTAWLIWQKTEFHGTSFDEVPFDAVIGVIHIFCFFNMKEGRSRFRALAFYSVIFVENTIMFGLWYCEQESREKMYGLPALVFVWGGFFLGLLVMALYYRFCHPTGKLPFCLRGLDELDEKLHVPIGGSPSKNAPVKRCSSQVDRRVAENDMVNEPHDASEVGVGELDGVDVIDVVDGNTGICGSAENAIEAKDAVDEVSRGNRQDKQIITNLVDEEHGGEVVNQFSAGNGEDEVKNLVDEVHGDVVDKENLNKVSTTRTAINERDEIWGSTADGVVHMVNKVNEANTINAGAAEDVVHEGNMVNEVNIVHKVDVVNEVNVEDIVVDEAYALDVINEVDVADEVKVENKVDLVDETFGTDISGRDGFEGSDAGGVKHKVDEIHPRVCRRRSLLERDRYRYIFSQKWRRQISEP